jgi:hypothetical protein
MRDMVTAAGWLGGAMLLSVSLMVLCQHAEGERTRAELREARSHVDHRIQVLDARLTDLQADMTRRKLASAASSANPPLDPRRLVRASQELERLIRTPPPSPPVSKPPQAAAPSTPPARTSPHDLVHACPGGHFYHRAGCKRVQKPANTIERSAAQAQGLKRCPTCLP